MKEPKKKIITFFCGSLQQGGAERVTVNLANHWSKKYYINIITTNDAPSFYPLAEKINHIKLGLAKDTKNNIWMGLLNNFKIIQALKKNIRKNKTTHLISFVTDANLVALMATIGLGLKIVVSDRVDPNAEIAFMNPLKLRLKKWLYRLADYVVIQTQGSAAYYQPWLEESKIVIINNPIQDRFCEYKEIKNNIEKIILSVGRLVNQKNFELLIKSFSVIANTDWQVIIVGEGNLRANLQELINENALVDRICLVGTSSEVIEWYLRASIFVLPSRFEGYPNALIEAMAMGLPVISTNCNYGPSEIIEDGKNGLLVASENVEEMSKALQKLMKDAHLRKRLGNEAEKIREKLNIEQIAKQWEALM